MEQAKGLSVLPRYPHERRHLFVIMKDKSSVLADAIFGRALDNALDVTPVTTDLAKLEPTHEEISVVAHQIYDEKGCPQ